MKHVPGPWELSPSGQFVRKDTKGDGHLVICEVNRNWHTSKETQIANALRIVECVNAMEGIDDPKKFRENREAVKHLELDKYHNLKEVIQNMIDRLDEGGEITLTKDSIIVLALKGAIQ